MSGELVGVARPSDPASRWWFARGISRHWLPTAVDVFETPDDSWVFQLRRGWNLGAPRVVLWDAAGDRVGSYRWLREGRERRLGIRDPTGQLWVRAERFRTGEGLRFVSIPDHRELGRGNHVSQWIPGERSGLQPSARIHPTTLLWPGGPTLGTTLPDDTSGGEPGFVLELTAEVDDDPFVKMRLVGAVLTIELGLLSECGGSE